MGAQLRWQDSKWSDGYPVDNADSAEKIVLEKANKGLAVYVDLDDTDGAYDVFEALAQRAYKAGHHFAQVTVNGLESVEAKEDDLGWFYDPHVNSGTFVYFQ